MCLQMLARFATGASFSADSRGGGKESNARFLPFMVQMAAHLLEQGSSSGQQRRTLARSVAAYLAPPGAPAAPPPPPVASPAGGVRAAAPAAEETVQFMMVASLLSESYEDWSRHRVAFLQRGLHHACAQQQHAHDRAAELFAAVKPILVYVGLIERLQRFFKLPPPRAEATAPAAADEGSGGGGGLERWEVAMKERLGKVKEMAGFSKELLPWLEDMTSAESLQEAFDVMGLLGDVLCTGDYPDCEAFVTAAVQKG